MNTVPSCFERVTMGIVSWVPLKKISIDRSLYFNRMEDSFLTILFNSHFMWLLNDPI